MNTLTNRVVGVLGVLVIPVDVRVHRLEVHAHSFTHLTRVDAQPRLRRVAAEVMLKGEMNYKC